MGTLVLWMLLAACSGGDETDAVGPGPDPETTGDTSSDDPTGDTAVDDTLRLSASDGATATRDFTVGTLVGLEGQDLRFDLGMLTADARGRPVLPGDVAELVLLELSPDDLDAAVGLVDGRGPAPADALEWWSTEPAGTSVLLSSFEARGAGFVPDAYFIQDNPRSWLLLLRDARGGVLHAATLAPDPVAGLAVILGDDLSAETFTEGSSTPVTVGVGDAPLLDWSASTDLYGDPIDAELADTLELFVVTAGAAVDLEGPTDGAQRVYRREVMGDTEAELSFLRADDQSLFDGFAADVDTWAALWCSTCASRAPLLLVPFQATEAR